MAGLDVQGGGARPSACDSIWAGVAIKILPARFRVFGAAAYVKKSSRRRAWS